MTSGLLKVASKHIALLQLGLSIFLLLRGHNEPGGGFIGGLIAASAFILIAMAQSVEQGRRWMKLKPHIWMSGGLLLATASSLVSLFLGKPMMTSVWGGSIWLPLVEKIKLGTPLLFDIGVYFVVVGICTLIIFTLMEEEID